MFHSQHFSYLDKILRSFRETFSSSLLSLSFCVSLWCSLEHLPLSARMLFSYRVLIWWHCWDTTNTWYFLVSIYLEETNDWKIFKWDAWCWFHFYLLGNFLMRGNRGGMEFISDVRVVFMLGRVQGLVHHHYDKMRHLMFR